MRLLAFVTSAVVLASSNASASPVSVTVVGDVCDLSGLDAELSNLLVGNEVADSQALVVTTGNGQLLSADVVVVDAAGQSHGPRTVTASTCADLFDSIAVVIAMAVSGPPDPVTDVEAAPPLAAPKVVEPARDTAISITQTATIERPTALSIDGYIDGAHTTSSANEQIQVGARVKRGIASISLQIGAGVPEQVPVSSTGKISITQVELTVAPCMHVESLSGCALISAGALHGSGESLYGARVVSVPSAATGVRLGWEHFITNNVALRLHLDARAMLTSAAFDVDNMPVWKSSRFEGSAAVGLLARFL